MRESSSELEYRSVLELPDNCKYLREKNGKV